MAAGRTKYQYVSLNLATRLYHVISGMARQLISDYNICLFQRDFMAQTTQTTQQQAAQQKEIARKLEEYIDKLDRVLI